MGQREISIWVILFFIGSIAFPSYGTPNQQKETHKLLMSVNTQWKILNHELKFDFKPNSEQELVQLHLLNVVSYLENQDMNKLNEHQKKNRLRNIETLKNYTLSAEFPINNITNYRTPIFIDYRNVHCAVGYLMKESGFGEMAKEIASKQLLFYLKDIEHDLLENWQKYSGLSLFELALIQPTYGPPTPVCGAPSPIQWNEGTASGDKITKLIESQDRTSIYAIAQTDELGLNHNIINYSPDTDSWENIGSQIKGQIFDLVFIDNQIYISVLIPEENIPHQILKLNGRKWEKVAHFDRNIISIQAFENKLYVLGNFRKVNDTISSRFVVIDANSIQPFEAFGLNPMYFDEIKSSKTALFLTSYGGIYKFKNDTINLLTGIKYYQYITNFTIEAELDTFYVASVSISGFNKYYDNQEHSIHNNNMMSGRSYPHHSVNFTKSKIMNGNMIIAGDFRSSTLSPQINDNRQLVHCADTNSLHWYGEGLLFQKGQTFYPILKEGIVLDFVQLNNQIFILENDGNLSYTELAKIEKEVGRLEERRALK